MLAHASGTKSRFLLGTRNIFQVRATILGVKFHSDLASQARRSAIESTRLVSHVSMYSKLQLSAPYLDTSHIRHDLKFGIQA